MIGMFTMLSAVLWYLIDFIKKILTKISGENKIIKDLVYDIILWVIAIVGGLLLAFTFKLDAFVMVSQMMRGITKIPIVDSTVVGSVFGGLLLASGSGTINALFKAIGKAPEEKV